MRERVVIILKNGSLVVNKNILYLHIFDGVLEKHALHNLLLNLVSLRRLCLAASRTTRSR